MDKKDILWSMFVMAVVSGDPMRDLERNVPLTQDDLVWAKSKESQVMTIVEEAWEKLELTELGISKLA